MSAQSFTLRILLAGCTLTLPVLSASTKLYAQAAPVASTTQAGTVQAVSGSSITILNKVNVTLAIVSGADTRFLQVAPGATDLKSATPATLADITVGDKLLVSGHPGDGAATFTAGRIVILKSGDIATLHAQQAADWQRRGTAGLVRQVNGPTLIVANGSRTLTVSTTPTTIYRRYAGDSIKFEDARPGTLADIRSGDQLRVRGAKSDDGSAVTADEIVSGSFENLAGTLTAVDAAQGTITLKDLATKKTVVVLVTANSEIHHLPEPAAAAYARTHSPAAIAAAAANPAPASSAPASSASSGAAPAGPGQRRGNLDLSQMMARLPAQPLSELKAGDAVLIVASAGSGAVTAVTMLSGVEPILTASPAGTAPTLSPWNLAVPEGSGGAQ